MDDEDWLTYAEAAEILGCGPANVPKLIAKGHLQTRHQLTGQRARAGTLRRADVVALAQFRTATELERGARAARARVKKMPPDDDLEWVTIPEAARQLGRTPEAVLARLTAGRLPATRVGRRWWICQDQLTIIEAGRLGTKTKRI